MAQSSYRVPPSVIADVLGEDGYRWALELQRLVFGADEGAVGSLDYDNVVRAPEFDSAFLLLSESELIPSGVVASAGANIEISDGEFSVLQGPDSGLDADTLDGREAAAFVWSLAGLAGAITLTAGDNVALTIEGQAITISATGGEGSLSDGDYVDVAVSDLGATWTINDGVVTYAKMQDVSATDRILGRSTAGAGDIEEIACTASGRALIAAATAAAQRSALGLGSFALLSSLAFGGLSDVDMTTPPTLNAVPKWNGTNWVPGDITDATEFSFAVDSFGATGRSTVELIGTVGGTWVTSQAFTATYSFDPDSASVAVSAGGSGGWPVSMAGPNYTASSGHSETVSYPSLNGSRTFTITAALSGYDDATDTHTTYFRNKKWWGMYTSATPAPTDAQYVGSLSDGGSAFVTTGSATIALSQVTIPLDGTSKYLHFVFPERLLTAITGDPVFIINGFTVTFDELTAATFDNQNGYSETYRKFRSPIPYDNGGGASSMTFEVTT